MSEKPILFSGPMVRAILEGRKTQTRREVKTINGVFTPRYKIDDTLWIRERWNINHVDYIGKGQIPKARPTDLEDDQVCYAATETDAEINNEMPWRPSIHMPRWASRITLRVTGVKVERLQEISEADAEAEGAPPTLVPPDGGSWPHYEGFRELWQSINGIGSWYANPWVAAYTFEVLQ